MADQGNKRFSYEESSPPSIWSEIIEKLRSRGKIYKCAIFEGNGSVLASTPGFGYLLDSDLVALRNAMKDSKSHLFSLEIQRVHYTCMRASSSTLIGRRERSLFIAHLCFSNSRILIGYSDINHPGSCIEEVELLEKEFSTREEFQSFCRVQKNEDIQKCL